MLPIVIQIRAQSLMKEIIVFFLQLVNGKCSLSWILERVNLELNSEISLPVDLYIYIYPYSPQSYTQFNVVFVFHFCLFLFFSTSTFRHFPSAWLTVRPLFPTLLKTFFQQDSLVQRMLVLEVEPRGAYLFLFVYLTQKGHNSFNIFFKGVTHCVAPLTKKVVLVSRSRDLWHFEKTFASFKHVRL